MIQPECISCGKEMDASALFATATAAGDGTGAFVAACPHCAAGVEFQIRSGMLILGYTYFGGSLHFEGMVDVPLRGLRELREDGRVTIVYAGERYDATPPRREQP